MDLTAQRGALAVDLDRRRTIFFDHAATWLLIQKFGDSFAAQLYKATPVDGPNGLTDLRIELLSMDVLVYALWAGLQAEARQAGEEFTLEQAGAAIRPFNYARVTRAVVYALIGATALPELPGKGVTARPAASQAAATPAAPRDPGPARVTASSTRNGSRTPSSAGRRRGSGARRSAS